MFVWLAQEFSVCATATTCSKKESHKFQKHDEDDRSIDHACGLDEKFGHNSIS